MLESVKDPMDFLKMLFKELDEKDKEIIKFLKKYPNVTTKTMIEQLRIDEKLIKSKIRKLREMGLVKSPA